jgi:tetratricopeptide (TPR) repeat protein
VFISLVFWNMLLISRLDDNQQLAFSSNTTSNRIGVIGELTVVSDVGFMIITRDMLGIEKIFWKPELLAHCALIDNVVKSHPSINDSILCWNIDNMIYDKATVNYLIYRMLSVNCESVLYAMASLLINEKLFGLSVAIMELYSIQYPNSIYLKYTRFKYSASTSNWRAACEDAGKCYRSNTKALIIGTVYANLLLFCNNHQKGINILRQIYEISPNCNTYYNYLEGLRVSGQAAEALEGYKSLLDNGEINADMLLQRCAECHLMRKEIPECLKMLSELSPTSNSNPDKILLLAACHYTNKNYYIALKWLDFTMALSIPKIDAYLLYGDIYYSKADYAHAVKYYQIALRLQPDDHRSQLSLAWLYAACPDDRYCDINKCLDCLVKLRQKQGLSTHEMLAIEAVILYRSGRAADAKAMLECALKVVESSGYDEIVKRLQIDRYAVIAADMQNGVKITVKDSR